MVEVRLTTQFNRELGRIRDRRVAQSVEQAIDTLKAANQLIEVAGVTRLVNRGPRYRMRIGDYRLIMLMDDEGLTLERLLHRREAYGRRGRG